MQNLKTKTHTFQIERLHSRARVDVDVRVIKETGIDGLKELVIDATRKLATGNQKRVTTIKRSVHDYFEYCPTLWDALKEALIKWEPNLNFGWLKPNYETIEVRTDITQEVYYNVMPVEQELPPHEHLLRIESLLIPTKLGWLAGEPPTRAEVEYEVEQWRAKDLAKVLGLAEYLNNRCY